MFFILMGEHLVHSGPSQRCPFLGPGVILSLHLWFGKMRDTPGWVMGLGLFIRGPSGKDASSPRVCRPAGRAELHWRLRHPAALPHPVGQLPPAPARGEPVGTWGLNFLAWRMRLIEPFSMQVVGRILRKASGLVIWQEGRGGETVGQGWKGQSESSGH